MDFSQLEQNPDKKFTGLAVAVLLHVFIVYALFTGLARKVVEVIAKPVETKIIKEVAPPPPPDLPPPPPPPKMVAPPPPFIPPPEVQVAVAPQANTIASTTAVRPDAPFVPPTRTTESTGVRVNAVVIASACPEPEYPARSLRNEETGVTTLSLLVGLDGKVADSKIEKSSGFKDLDNAARAGLARCKFKPATVDGKPEMTWSKIQYVWKLD